MNSPQNFYPKPGKNFAFCPGQVRQAVAVMPFAAKVLKQVMVNTGGNKGRSPQNVKTAAPETQQMMGLKTSDTGGIMSAFSFNTTYQPTGDQQKDAIAQIGIMQNRAVQKKILHKELPGWPLRCSTAQSIMSCMTYWIVPRIILPLVRKTLMS